MEEGNVMKKENDRKDLLIDDMYPPEEVELTPEEIKKIRNYIKALTIFI